MPRQSELEMRTSSQCEKFGVALDLLLGNNDVERESKQEIFVDTR